MSKFHALIIGGGATGCALAHDLTLRGLQVTLVERHEITSGTSGRHHGLLHSGGRYAVKDQESARECIEENMILRHIMPGSLELNDGLFVALTDEDVEYSKAFMAGCAACDIPARVLTREQALAMEPKLNPKTKMAIQVPDGTMDAWRMPARFIATAKSNGAVVKRYTEVLEIKKQAGVVSGVRVRDNLSNKEYEIGADIVINAGGPWSGKIAEMADVDVPVRPSPGVMLAVYGRLCNMVVNHLAPSSDGDIIVPIRGLSVVGTTSWVVEDPDDLGLPKDHVQRMWEKGAELIPEVAQSKFRGAWSAARPLVGARGADTGRELSRTFKCFDHYLDESVEGFVTITGGKATTARGMAEVTADIVCGKLGIDEPCRTREVILLPHTAFFN
ncbi:MAG: FAD-dependent oxidoreductase [Candidatus Promineifilaceae bacterium]